MNKLALLALAVLLAFSGYSAWVFNQEPTIDGPIEITGTRAGAAYLLPNPGAPTVRVYVLFQSGEMENDGPEGLAHYLEHLAWMHVNDSGTSTAGRHSNAWTSSSTTAYWLEADTQKFSQTLDTLLGVTERPNLDPEFALQERDIVQREYDLRLSEDPFAPIYADMQRTLFAATPYARSVIGSPESIAAITVEDALALHAKTHQLKDAIVIVVGDVTPQRIKLVLAGDAPRREMPLLPPLPIGPLDDRKDMRVDVASPVLIYQHIVTQPDCGLDRECFAAINILQDILGGVLPGGLAGPLRFDNFIARSFDIQVSGIGPDGISLWFAAEPDVGVDLVTLQARFEAELDLLIENGVPPETFDKIKERFVEYHNDDDEKFESMLDRMIGELSSRIALSTNAENRANAEGVTLEHVNAVLAAFKTQGRVVVRRVSPLE